VKKTYQQDKKKGIMIPLLEALGGEDKVLESQVVLQQLKEMAEKDLIAVLKRILKEPTDVPQWQDQIALLIGEAKRIQKYKELFTIKEK